MLRLRVIGEFYVLVWARLILDMTLHSLLELANRHRFFTQVTLVNSLLLQTA